MGSTLHVEQREIVSPRTVFMCDSYMWIRTLREKLNKEKQLSPGLHDLHKLNLSLLRQIEQAHLGLCGGSEPWAALELM